MRTALLGKCVLLLVTFASKLARMEVRKLHRSAILVGAKVKLKELLSYRPGLKLRLFLV